MRINKYQDTAFSSYLLSLSSPWPVDRRCCASSPASQTTHRPTHQPLKSRRLRKRMADLSDRPRVSSADPSLCNLIHPSPHFAGQLSSCSQLDLFYPYLPPHLPGITTPHPPALTRSYNYIGTLYERVHVCSFCVYDGFILWSFNL